VTAGLAFSLLACASSPAPSSARAAAPSSRPISFDFDAARGEPDIGGTLYGDLRRPPYGEAILADSTG
jgi:hypothetical protein